MKKPTLPETFSMMDFTVAEPDLEISYHKINQLIDYIKYLEKKIDSK